MNKYDSNGYLVQSNSNSSICRNEVNGTVYLRDRPYYQRATGGVTAVLIKEDKSLGQTKITTINFHDIGGILWFLLILIIGTIFLINQKESIWTVVLTIILFSVLFGLFHGPQLKRQKIFIESVIQKCEMH